MFTRSMIFLFALTILPFFYPYLKNYIKIQNLITVLFVDFNLLQHACKSKSHLHWPTSRKLTYDLSHQDELVLLLTMHIQKKGFNKNIFSILFIGGKIRKNIKNKLGKKSMSMKQLFPPIFEKLRLIFI